MIDFSQVSEIIVNDNNITYITETGGGVLWKSDKIRYVSFGDSIAAGHSITESWVTDYGEGSQYGKNGNTSTTIVPNCYTDLIKTHLKNTYGQYNVSAISFARSGDTVADLLNKLSHENIIRVLSKTNYVTICIGANDVLQTAMNQLSDYIMTGDLSNIEASVKQNLETLNNDLSNTSYYALLNRLNEINPNATYVFTTVYNPYKYLWIEEGNDGFFSPLLDEIPDMTILGFNITEQIKSGLLNTPIVKQLFERVNGLGDWVESALEGNNNLIGLNKIIRNKVSSYANNYTVADTKILYDGFPDRPISATKHYNDLVSVEYTKGFDCFQMDWGQLYKEKGASDYWWDLATSYVSTSGFDINGFAEELVGDIVEKVIAIDLDPHPETYGQYILKRSFVNKFGWETLDSYTISYNANGGSGNIESKTIYGVDSLPMYTNIAENTFSVPDTGYYFTNWNTSGDGTGNNYGNGAWVGFNTNVTLYAQWSNLYYVRYDAYSDSMLLSDTSNTGKQDYYALVIDGDWKDKFGKFSNSSQYFYAPYGTTIVVVAGDSEKNEQSYIDVDGTIVTEKDNFVTYSFTLTANVRVRFEANKYYSGITLHEYWIGHVISI